MGKQWDGEESRSGPRRGAGSIIIPGETEAKLCTGLTMASPTTALVPRVQVDSLMDAGPQTTPNSVNP